MRFKVGDKVKIKKDLREGHNYTTYVSREMETYKGQIMTIKDIEYGYYVLEEAKRNNYFLNWHWSDDMLEPIKFTLDDLQFGDILTSRNGERYVYVDSYMFGEDSDYYCDCDEVKDCYNNDLKRESNNNYDIVKIERAGQVVYEREEVREMTVEEISKALGYEVKVVK